MARIKQDRPNPYTAHIKMAVSDGKKDYVPEELGEEAYQRILLRGGLSAMFHLHNIGLFHADISGWALKPDERYHT